jgi:hypothetical protein
MADFGHAIGIPATPAERDQPTQPATPAERDQPAQPAYGSFEAYPASPPYEPQPAQPTAAPDLDLETAHAQARAQAESGDLTGARTMLEEALASGELRLGRSDPALVPLMVDVATLARRLGNLTEAANQLRRAYGIAAAASGPQHPTSLSIEGRLAAVLYRLGESTEAYDWHLADAGRRVLGDEHPAVRGAQQRLAALAGTPTSRSPAPHPVQSGPPPAPFLVPPPAPFPPAPPAPFPPAPPAPFPVTPQVPAAEPSLPAVPAVPAVKAVQAVHPGRLYGPAIEGDIWEAGDATVRSRRRGSGGVVLVASLGAVILVVVVVVALALFAPPPGQPTGQEPGPQQSEIAVTANPTPTAAPTSPAPTAVRVVEDGGGTVTLAWSDPSSGEVPFVVSGARAGDALVAIQTVPAGETTTTIYGLNINFDYCFTVAAVWSAEVIQESMRTCTHRLAVSAAPTS